jgi:peptide/nickel transport system substrate-binding protein/oligopeptide transport system substrate-binding protein
MDVEMWSDALEGVQTRRQLLANSAKAVGALALLAAASPVTALARPNAAAQLPRGGTLVYSTPAAPGFDPHKWWNSIAFAGHRNVFDTLVELDPYTAKIRPNLAVPSLSRNGTLYTFKLRPGVRFTTGRVLTAADVKYSLERLMSPATASEGATIYTPLPIVGMADLLNEKSKELKGIRAVDNRTLTIELERPDNVLVDVLSYGFAAVVPKDVVESVGDKKFNWAPVGSGAMIMKNVKPDKGLVLERNPRYWKRNVPYLDRVVWNIGVAPELAVLRIQRGEQDMMYEPVPSAAYDSVKNDSKLTKQLFVDGESQVFYLTLSMKHKALKNLKVRQAIASAVDKERLARVLKGLAIPATGGLLGPYTSYYQKNLAYPFDPERAKQLLTSAGYPDGFQVTLWGQNSTPFKEMLQTVQQDLKNVGITVDIKPMESDAFYALTVKNPSGMLSFSWGLAYPHGSYIMDSAFTKAALDAGCCNYSAWVNTRFDKLAQQAHTATEPGKVIQHYRDLDRMVVRDNAVWVPMFYGKRADLVSQRVRGFQVPNAGDGSEKYFQKYAVTT